MMSDQQFIAPGEWADREHTDDTPQLVPLTPHRRVTPVPPPPPTTLVGRQAELELARDLFHARRARLLTLTGPGGVGKTRMALEIVARRIVPGVQESVWVPLAPVRDPGRVVATIAAALHIGEVDDQPLLRSLTAALRNQRLLLVLDNFEHVLTAAADVATIMRACPDVIVLVTSRSALRISGEQVLPLPPLVLPGPQDQLSPDQLRDIEAVKLFIDRAENVSPSFALDQGTAPLVTHICQRLDGLPLAIELAAARVNHLSIQTLHDRLERRLPLLTGGPRDLPDRQQTLRNTIAWSHDLLTPDEQTLFRQLAVFVGGFTLEDAEAVCDGGETVLDRLSALVDKSLVHLAPDPGGDARYFLLETIHEYALEHLRASGDEMKVRQRHAAHFLQRVREEAPELAWGAIGGWGDDLEADHGNLRAALTWLAQSGQWQECLQLATALSGFWDARGQFGEGRSWLTLALDPEKTRDAPPDLRAGASTTLGLFVLRQGDLDLAESHLEAARAGWISVGDTNGLAFTLMVLGGLAEYRGDDAQAQPLYEQALCLFRDAGNLPGISMTLNNLADTAYRCGDFVQAKSLAQESVAVSREAKLPILTCNALITVGAAACALGDLDRAQVALHEALHASRNGGYQLTFADTVVGLAHVATAAGEPLRAARLLGAVERLAEGLGVPRLEHGALHRNVIAATRARLDEAAFRRAWEAGRVLSASEVLAEAEAVSPQAPLRTPVRLTNREREVLDLLVAGKTDRAIGEALFIGTRTVESHVARIFEKLRVRTRAAAVSTAIATGLAVPPHPDER